MDTPHTAEDLLALPELGMFTYEDAVVDGKNVRMVRSVALQAIWRNDTDVTQAIDANGQGWKLCQTTDGRWFKRRA